MPRKPRRGQKKKQANNPKKKKKARKSHPSRKKAGSQAIKQEVTTLGSENWWQFCKVQRDC